MKRIMPPTYFMFLLALSVLLHFFFPLVRFSYFPYNYIGILLIIFGIFLNLKADSMFTKSRTTVKLYLIPSSFHVSGPFKISRHPMYLGMFLILFGAALIMGFLTAFVLSFVFVALMEILFIPQEEKNMEKAFGKKYLEYKKRVRCWI